MAIDIKSPENVEKMRVSGKLAAEALTMIGQFVVPGVTTEELDRICHEYIVETQQAIPAPLNYHGFPKSICTSVNHVVCHGIPGKKTLKDGDIINIDITVIKDGYHGDTSKMFIIGEGSVKARKIVKIAHECMWLGIKQVKPGAHFGDIGAVIQEHAEDRRGPGEPCSVVHEYCGHGIGLNFHDEPQILHYGKRGTREVMEAGMTFTIEPMINIGKRYVTLMKDEWTVITKDRSLSAQWEHTLLVTEDGYEVLTLRDEEKEP